MYIILGGTGHIGSATTLALLRNSNPVTVVTRERAHAEALERAGATIAVADVHDIEATRAILRTGRRALLINPPADVKADSDVEETRTASSIVEAVKGSGLEKVVAASTYGAQPGERLGDLNVLFEFEEGLRAQGIPVAINRGAYYFSNWTPQIEAVRKRGTLQSFFPADFLLPMVAPLDLGEAAARRLTEPAEAAGLHHVEGPRRYSAQDVGDAFAAALKRPVEVEVVPREQWEAAFRAIGFSAAAAHSYTRMTAATLDEHYEMPGEPERGTVTLQDFINEICSTQLATSDF
ncbi:MAG: NmrA family NAD(P)-binding protein [Sphingomonas sp.]